MKRTLGALAGSAECNEASGATSRAARSNVEVRPARRLIRSSPEFSDSNGLPMQLSWRFEALSRFILQFALIFLDSRRTKWLFRGVSRSC